jgi:hypothetical protein
MDAYTKEPVRPNVVVFSDSFVKSVPLRDDGTGLVRVVTVFSALSAAAVVMIHSLAAKHALRGGIDVGLATEIGPGMRGAMMRVLIQVGTYAYNARLLLFACFSTFCRHMLPDAERAEFHQPQRSLLCRLARCRCFGLLFITLLLGFNLI